ncbi:hypothetical protein [Paraclostridium sp. AKS73]|uniref:hypothetical protein n=1 Tax=Paraclostridium sp. AKS73 TaxID=2876116 RepID=UPI0021DFC0DA|nr:hypothetical protein [Paraclostridium sp. AKS73]MCU9814651.1 hypothetical protein [Paraclostridium sp. AKS73]MDM8127954.1 hypothetical protein [Paraclostridium benzoelyticum]
MKYYIEQIEEDIKKCKDVYDGNYGDLDEDELIYRYDMNEIANTCMEMIGYYGDDIEFPNFVYNKCDEESLYMIMRLLDKHRRYMLDRAEDEKYRKEIANYKERISIYENSINGLERQIELLKENINTITYSKQAINIFATQTQMQEVATTVDIDNNIENKFEYAREQLLKDKDIEDRDELLEKIKELEIIYNEETAPTDKKEKARKVLSWVGDKSYKGMQLLIPLIQSIIETSN